MLKKNIGRGRTYQKRRAELLASNPDCVYCKTAKADTADHVPALASFPHPSMWTGILLPACRSCNSRRGARQTNRLRGTRRSREW